VDVSGSKTQQPESGIDEQVLAAIVLDEAVAMVAAVVLENKAGRRVVEVCPRDESAVAVMKIRLNLRARQVGLNQEPSESGFHRRFCGRRQQGEVP
jgi:hypothetical protein